MVESVAVVSVGKDSLLRCKRIGAPVKLIWLR